MADTNLLVAKITFVVAQTTFKVDVITSLLVKITFVVVQIFFKVAVVTYSVAKITLYWLNPFNAEPLGTLASPPLTKK